MQWTFAKLRKIDFRAGLETGIADGMRTNLQLAAQETPKGVGFRRPLTFSNLSGIFLSPI